MVRERLAALGLEHEGEIHAELAGHLEDVYQEARRCGCSEEEADARALAQVPDWAEVARRIQDANQEGAMISRDTRTLWLPGMAAVFGDVVLVLALIQVMPADLWTDPRAGVQVAIGSLVLVAYLGLGALGAGWSRFAGGSPRMRLLSGLFPLALHLAIVVSAIAMGIPADRQTPSGFPLNFQPGVLLRLVVAPGIALAIGTLPFLKDRPA
jgi:hypothetical protein